MTQAEAHRALAAFLADSQAAGRRCVLVITGKGTRGEGVLRAAVPRWLNEPPERSRVLSFSSAHPRHGGAGRLSVLPPRTAVRRVVGEGGLTCKVRGVMYTY